jgi:hypothetical protein
MGVVALGVGLLASVLVVRLGVPTGLRAIVFVPFFVAAFGGYQGLYRTCTGAGEEGVRITDHGKEPIVDPGERASSRREGRRVLGRAVLTAAVATLAIVLVP